MAGSTDVGRQAGEPRGMLRIPSYLPPVLPSPVREPGKIKRRPSIQGGETIGHPESIALYLSLFVVVWI